MIRIRAGGGWKVDPAVRDALRRSSARARADAALAIVDVLAIEVDGVDIAAGRGEGTLLPSLEGLLRAVARLLAGAPHASVAFEGGDLELALRRRGNSALLTLVAPGPPARVLATDVKVELDALAGAALDASADLCRDLAEAGAAAAPVARGLRAAARRLRATEAVPAPRPGLPAARRTPRRARRDAGAACEIELGEDDGALEAYAGGRPDLGALLAPGALRLRGAGDRELAVLGGPPFLALRDLSAAAARIVEAVRRGDPEVRARVGTAGRGGATELRLDLARGTAAVGRGPEVPCAPLALARAVLEAAGELGRVVRARNPRQGENAYLAELEAAAAERLALLDETAGGERVGAAPDARAPAPRRSPQRPLGPGRLRRLAFRRTASLDVGAPAGAGLLATGGLAVAAGAAGIVALDPGAGAIRWRAEGADLVAVVPGAVLAVRGGTLACLSPATGRTRWSRPLPGAAPTAALGLPRGPVVLVEPSAATGLDPGTGRTLWRFEPPSASRLHAAPFGGVAVVAADTGAVYGIDAAGGVAFRLHVPGPPLFAAVPACGAAVVVAADDPVARLVAIDPASGRRAFEASLEFVPTAPPLGAGTRVFVAGTFGGDPLVTAVDRGGALAFTEPPPLSGPVAIAALGAGVVAQDAAGAIAALSRDGAERWTFARTAGHAIPAPPPPSVVRGIVVAGGDGVVALDARTGAPLGLFPGVAPARLLVRPDLSVCALDADGAVAAWRLGTHLSVV